MHPLRQGTGCTQLDQRRFSSDLRLLLCAVCAPRPCGGRVAAVDWLCTSTEITTPYLPPYTPWPASVFASLASNVLCVGQTTLLSVYGSSLATRGPDGAMVQAVDGMYGLRRRIFRLFNAGMFSVLLMGIFGSWILFRPLTAFLMTLILAGCIYAVVVCQRRIVTLFHFAEDDAVSFDDLMEASEV